MPSPPPPRRGPPPSPSGSGAPSSADVRRAHGHARCCPKVVSRPSGSDSSSGYPPRRNLLPDPPGAGDPSGTGRHRRGRLTGAETLVRAGLRVLGGPVSAGRDGGRRPPRPVRAFDVSRGSCGRRPGRSPGGTRPRGGRRGRRLERHLPALADLPGGGPAWSPSWAAFIGNLDPAPGGPPSRHPSAGASPGRRPAARHQSGEDTSDRLVRACDDAAGVTPAFSKNTCWPSSRRHLDADFDLDRFAPRGPVGPPTTGGSRCACARRGAPTGPRARPRPRRPRRRRGDPRRDQRHSAVSGWWPARRRRPRPPGVVDRRSGRGLPPLSAWRSGADAPPDQPPEVTLRSATASTGRSAPGSCW